MSFIYDDKQLIEDLIKAGLDFDNTFSKKAQTTKLNPDQAKIALILLDNIENVVNPDEPIISSNLDKPEGLLDPYLEGIGALVRYVAANQLMVNGHRIAYDNINKPPAKDTAAYIPYELEANSFTGQWENQPTDRTLKNTFFINKDLLINYLMSLQAESHKQKNKLLEFKLKTLIGEANRIFNIKIDPNYKPPTKPGSEEPGKEPGGKPGETPGGQPASGGSSQSVKALVQMLPLQLDRIDFTRISRFFTALTNLMGAYSGPKSAEIKNNINNAMGVMQVTANMTANKDTVLSMRSSHEDVAMMLMSNTGTPVGRAYVPFLWNMQNIIVSTAAVVENFYIMYAGEDDERAKDKFTDEEIRKIKEQFLFIKNKNLEKLQGLRANANKVGIAI
jgi:hypothetical protein